jgi:hypothetical protein
MGEMFDLGHLEGKNNGAYLTLGGMQPGPAAIKPNFKVITVGSGPRKASLKITTPSRLKRRQKFGLQFPIPADELAVVLQVEREITASYSLVRFLHQRKQSSEELPPAAHDRGSGSRQLFVKNRE